METRANFVLIGAFTLLGIVGIVGLLLWFAKVELDQRFSYFDVRFDSVAGLSEASDVRFAGLPVGQVVDVRLSPDQDGTVLVRLEVESATPVRSDSIATIESQGVTGVSFVGISSGDAAGELLIPTSDAPVPQIASGQSAFQALTQDGPELISGALEVVEEVNVLFGPDNQLRIENILQNAEDASEALATTMEAFAQVPDTVERFVEQVEAFNTILADLSPEIEQLLVTADSTVGALGSLARESENTVVTANDTLAVAQGTFNDAQRYISEDLSDTTNALQASIEDMRAEIALISTDARTMLDTFEDAGAAARDRLTEAGETLTIVNDALVLMGKTAAVVTETAEGFDTLITEQASPLLSEARITITTATDAINTISDVATTDLPIIVEDIRSATAAASQTITQVASDVTAASGRIDGLSVEAEAALKQATETFANANITLEAITAAMETGETTLAAAQSTFEGADRIINEDIDGIVAGLEQSLASLNGAIGQVSADIPDITQRLRDASTSASDAFASLEQIMDSAGPPITDFSRTTLPMLTRLSDETRGLIANFDRLVVQIQRDPARFFLNQQSPEFQR